LQAGQISFSTKNDIASTSYLFNKLIIIIPQNIIQQNIIFEQ
jgi:hypothetical protein